MTSVPDHRAIFESFDPATVTGAFAGDLTSAVNACVECCDRHVGENRVALEWAGASGERTTFTFEDLRDRSAQVANLLVKHGVEPGDRVAGLLPRVPDLVTLFLGVLRSGAV